MHVTLDSLLLVLILVRNCQMQIVVYGTESPAAAAGKPLSTSPHWPAYSSFRGLPALGGVNLITKVQHFTALARGVQPIIGRAITLDYQIDQRSGMFCKAQPQDARSSRRRWSNGIEVLWGRSRSVLLHPVAAKGHVPCSMCAGCA
jgi:hypothetical protein